MISQPPKRILIAGGGFGGITAALTLAKEKTFLEQNGYEVILIDRHHHQLFTPALYEIAAIPRETNSDPKLKAAMLLPFSDILKKPGFSSIWDEVIGLDPEKKELLLEKTGGLKFEYLILALGSETNYFNIPGLKEHSFPLKTFDDAIRLRNKIEDAVQKKDHVRIAVGGAGASGVELAAEFVNFVCDIKEQVSPGNLCSVEFLLIEAGPEILAGFPKNAIAKTRKRLQNLGVTIKTNAAIASVTAEELTYAAGTKENFDILIWTGGVRGPGVFEKMPLQKNPKGVIPVNEYLQTHEAPYIYAIGDNSGMINPKTEKPLPWNASVAESQGKITAKNIIRRIRNKKLKKFIPLKNYPFLLAIGRKYAIANLIFFSISGFIGWTIKQLVELNYLLFVLPFKKALTAWIRAVKIYSSND